MRLKVVDVPAIQKPIQRSPGFAKKLLADDKLDLLGLCGFGCSYCSSNAGNYLRINRERFADLTEAQIGERLLPSGSPELTFAWPDVLSNLEAQLATKPRYWGAGRTLVFSQLTDGFSPLLVANGTTRRALDLVLERTSFRVRVLTKSAVVGTSKWIEYFAAHPGRFVVGLSVGTRDDAWARRIEVGTSSPSARLRALGALQRAGVPTYGMLCPIFPDVLQGGELERLVEAVNPSAIEHLWWEPFNDRANWRAVRDGYDRKSWGYGWFSSVYEAAGPETHRKLWSHYAEELYTRVRTKAAREGWTAKLRYLLYEGDITAGDAAAFKGLEGVLLQGVKLLDEQEKPKPTGWSANPAIRALQRHEGHGCAGWAATARSAA